MSKSKQSVNVRLTKEANKILDKWKRKYGGLSKSETIKNVTDRLRHLEMVENYYANGQTIN